jgi:hypothetical protein
MSRTPNLAAEPSSWLRAATSPRTRKTSSPRHRRGPKWRRSQDMARWAAQEQGPIGRAWGKLVTGIVATAHLVDQPGDREALCGEPISDYSPDQVRMWRQCQGCMRLAQLLAEPRLMARRLIGVDVRTSTRTGNTTYRVRWRDPDSHRQHSHTFTDRAAAIDAKRTIELAGNHCYCPVHCPPDSEGGQYGVRDTTTITWGTYAQRHIANRPGISDHYRAQFLGDIDRHMERLAGLTFDKLNRDRVAEWIRTLERPDSVPPPSIGWWCRPAASNAPPSTPGWPPAATRSPSSAPAAANAAANRCTASPTPNGPPCRPRSPKASPATWPPSSSAPACASGRPPRYASATSNSTAPGAGCTSPRRGSQTAPTGGSSAHPSPPARGAPSASGRPSPTRSAHTPTGAGSGSWCSPPSTGRRSATPTSTTGCGARPCRPPG